MAKKSGTPGKRKAIKKLAIVLVALFLILGSFILYLAMPLINGTKIILAIRPVDPFDPLRGQYMTIAYETGTIGTIVDAREGDTVYVSLAPDADGIWRETVSSLLEPEDVFIKGKIRSIRGDTMTVEYGIEQFFFEKGATFPNVPANEVFVEAKVDKNGRARVVRFLHNNEPMKIQYREVKITS